VSEARHSPLLVIGASGFLGSRITALAPSDVAVIGTHHAAPLEPPVAGRRAAMIRRRLDVRDHDAIDALVEATRPAAVVNCAYVQHGPDLDAITAVAPGVLAAAAQRVGAQFAHVSSDVVFAGRDGHPYREGDEPAPVHDYGRAKQRAEQAVTDAHDAPLIVRTSLLYRGAAVGAAPSPDGAREGPQERLVRVALGDGDVSFFTDEVRNPIAVDTLASAIIELVTTGHHGMWHVAGADAVDRLTFARLLAAAMGGDPQVLRGGPRDHAQGPRPGNLALDCAKARSALATPLPGVRSVLSRPASRSDTDW
jgi:dTDP-4-dehydrorhamnose reductase